MTKNPFLNAFLAVAYIALVASVMYYGPKIAGPVDSVAVPIAMLSLFVLSAAVMGCLFFYQPARLYFDGEKKPAVRLFLGTLAFFAVITVLLFTVIFVFQGDASSVPLD